MLLPDQVKPFLGHEEKIVRDHAVKNLAKSFNRDPGLMPLVLESCTRHGEEESGRLLAYAADFIQSEISLHTVLERLAQSDNPKAIHHYNDLIGRADIALLKPLASKIRKSKNIAAGTVDRLQRRLALMPYTTEVLWEELFAYCDEIAHKRIDQIYFSHGLHLVEALARRGDLPVEELLDCLQDGDTYHRYEELYLTILAGEARIEKFVPVLLGKLRIDTDLLCQEAAKSLIKIGTGQVIERLKTCFPSESWGFRNFSAPIFGHVKTPQAEDALLEMLSVEENLSIKTFLAMGICDLISEKGIPVVRRLIDNNDYDREIVDLRKPLYAACRMLKLELEEMDDWREELQQAEQITKRRMEAMETSLPLQFPQFLSVTGSPQKNVPRKIGRNEPCPCDSGKKYKRCCGRT